MPYLAGSKYRAPLWLPGGHAQTIFPALFRRVPKPAAQRVRLATPEGDDILLDVVNAAKYGVSPQARVAAILSHGLEGNSRRAYMRGMCLALAACGWDVVARNLPTCGGEMNKAPTMYHSGQTDDLHRTVEYCLETGYGRLLLVGFSLGGNQTLKYLGENPARVPEAVAGAAVFSVPCDLAASAGVLDRPGNFLYRQYFFKGLRHKIRLKNSLYPELYPLDGLGTVRTFAEFDNRYTAPVHGFSSAEDYWKKASSLPCLKNIAVPTLLVNARNDPFLSSACFPVEQARQHHFLTLEIPRSGGHVGFSSAGNAPYWSEQRAVEFFRGILG